MTNKLMELGLVEFGIGVEYKYTYTLYEMYLHFVMGRVA